jgi:outer membrane lipoprotein SlyB
MNKKALMVAVSTALLISGCASMGKEERIGKNDSSDPCFASLDRLDNVAIYYKDQRMKDIATGAAIGGAVGVLSGLAIGGNDTAMIVGGITGALAGGFAADAYWKNKMQKAHNQMNVAMMAVESDLRQDVARLSTIDTELAALLRCRLNQRDMIRKNYAEKKITQQQAQQEWKKWGDLVRKDREEMKYLTEALNNVKKLEQSYDYAAAAMGSASTQPVSQNIQQPPSQVQINTHEIDEAEIFKAPAKTKTKTKMVSKHKPHTQIAKGAGTNNVTPTSKGSSVQLLVASVHEKHESIQKNKAQIEHLALEAGNDKGFEQISSQAFPILFANIDSSVYVYLKL